jgi:hypothetical protein
VGDEMILSGKEFEKIFVDELEDKFIPLMTPDWTICENAYTCINDLEKTFYTSTKDNINKDFLIFILSDGMVYEFDGLHKSDGTKSSGVYFIVSLKKSLGINDQKQKILILLKKGDTVKKRIEYITNKYGGNLVGCQDGPNKGFLNNNHKQLRSPIESRLRHECFKRDNYRCKECGKTNEETTLHCDHILPVSQGGKDELGNLQTLCDACNLAKSNRCWDGGC